MLSYLVRAAVGLRPPAQRPAALLRVLARAGTLSEARAATCEVARMLVGRLGLGPGLQDDLDLVYERYDGRRSTGAISLPAQLVQMAEAATEHVALGGRDAAVAMLRDRRGRALRPDLVDAFLSDLGTLLDEQEGTLWDAVIAAEPGDWPRMPLAPPASPNARWSGCGERAGCTTSVDWPSRTPCGTSRRR